jgi:hypothetical protein
MTSFIRIATLAAATVLSLQLTGCANFTMSPPTATIENTAKLRGANIAPAAVGTFKVDAANAAMDKGTSIRGNALGTSGGSFAQYLGENLKVELQSAGLLDPASSTVISGTLTNSEVHGDIGTGTAKLAARFVVTRGNAVQFDRELKVDDSWESSFVGATAIPMAARHYEGLYRKLITTLLDDAAFRTAVSKQ